MIEILLFGCGVLLYFIQDELDKIRKILEKDHNETP